MADQPTPEQRAFLLANIRAVPFRELRPGDAAFLLAEVDRLTADNNRLRSGLEWFADEGRYIGTHRKGAAFADVFGCRFARGLLDGKTIEQLEDE